MSAGAINGSEDFRDNTVEFPLRIKLNCLGNESHLKECRSTNLSATCSAFDNAYVICQSKMSFQSMNEV